MRIWGDCRLRVYKRFSLGSLDLLKAFNLKLIFYSFQRLQCRCRRPPVYNSSWMKRVIGMSLLGHLFFRTMKRNRAGHSGLVRRLFCSDFFLSLISQATNSQFDLCFSKHALKYCNCIIDSYLHLSSLQTGHPFEPALKSKRTGSRAKRSKLDRRTRPGSKSRTEQYEAGEKGEHGMGEVMFKEHKEEIILDINVVMFLGA